MKTSNAALKLRARRALLGKYGITTGALFSYFGIVLGMIIGMEVFLIIGLLFSAREQTPWLRGLVFVILLITYAVILFVEMMMLLGIQKVYLNICKDEKCQVTDIFFAFRNHMKKFVVVALLLGLIVIVVKLPNIVLSIASSYTHDIGYTRFLDVFHIIYIFILMIVFMYLNLTYGQFYLILVENPEKGIWKSLLESRELMRGNKWRYFVLGLSFMGWILLVYCTFGIGGIWTAPYVGCTYTQFYLDLKPQIEIIPPQQAELYAWQEEEIRSEEPSIDSLCGEDQEQL